jgi:predicted metal-binding membrane protein
MLVWTNVAVLFMAAVAWVGTLRMPMHGDMHGMGMTMMPTVGGAAGYVAAWTVMMAAMMLPSAAPMIGLYAATQRAAASAASRTRAVMAFGLVYLAVWAATGVPIYFAGLALMAVGPTALAYVTAGVLVAAGVYQMTPLKQVCLGHCRSPIGFLMGHWRDGSRGALSMGWAHAWYCVGCCWALMGVLVVAGAMGLRWVLLIAGLVAAEKLLPRGEAIARITGAALVLLGLAVAVHPLLASALRVG